MMKKISELTNEELLKTKKNNNLVRGLIIGFLVALTILNLFNIINGDQHWGVLAVPLCLMLFVLLNHNSIREIDEELKSRGLL